MGRLARVSRGGAGAHALEPLLDAVVGEAPARSVVGFVPERLGPIFTGRPPGLRAVSKK